MADDFSTVMIDTATRELLRSLANSDDRSMAAELRWLVNQELNRRAPAAQTPAAIPTTEAN